MILVESSSIIDIVDNNDIMIIHVHSPFCPATLMYIQRASLPSSTHKIDTINIHIIISFVTTVQEF